MIRLNPDLCPWIHGTPSDRDARQCDAARHPGKPYCGAHCAASYKPVRPDVDLDPWQSSPAAPTAQGAAV
jgi:hypothetical protein